MMRGRKPKPTELKRADGNPGRRPLNPDEPIGKPSRLRVPKWLKEDRVAAAEYRRMGKLLLERKVMTDLDEMALSIYAKAFSQMLNEEAELDKEGSILTGAKGSTYPNPRVWIVKTCREQLAKFLVEFGMTPSSRSRIKTVAADVDGSGKGSVVKVTSGQAREEVAAAAKEWKPPATEEVAAKPPLTMEETHELVLANPDKSLLNPPAEEKSE